VILTNVHQLGLGFDFCNHLKKYDSEFLSKIKGEPTFQILGNHSNTILLIKKLLDIGYNEVQIKKILGENFLRVYKRVFSN
jgi:membrane dipeptidase